MKKSELAPVVASPLETQQERFAALVVFGDGEGRGLSIPDASRRMGIQPQLGYDWWRSRVVQDYVREQLDTLRNEAKLKAVKHVDTAIGTLYEATQSPVYTTAQVNAAKALLTFAFGEKESASANVALQVNVTTGVSPEAMALQQRRHGKKEQAQVAEFVELPVE